MSDPAIRVTGLGKRYRLRHEFQAGRYRTLREDLLQRPSRLWASARGAGREEFWALKEVSFEIMPGEVIGVIGRNGAGKSTLLKILSRITPPTVGEVELLGRVGSLLEVGTGFHPELTGRENIFLSGAILGMRRLEIRRRFDEIVAFAGVEQFLDTPCKHYSSGMYLRLGFAVAAHLDAEILVVDEVLAVGDAEFQRKCLGKMGEVASGGRTVLFVSHNLAALRAHCRSCFWLDKGWLRMMGNTEEVLELYYRNAADVTSLETIDMAIAALPPDPTFRLQKVAIMQDGRRTLRVANGAPIDVQITYTVFQRVSGLRVYFDLLDENRTILVRSFHDDDRDSVPFTEPGTYVSTAVIPANFLAPRVYELRVRGAISRVRTCQADGVGVSLEVEYTSRINRAYLGQPIQSRLQPMIPWTTTRS